jgi:putative DNA primase/helicase
MHRTTPEKGRSRKVGQQPYDTLAAAQPLGSKERLPASRIAEEILVRNSFARDRGGNLYVYENGVYRPSGERFIQRAAIEVLNEYGRRHQWTSHIGAEATKYIGLTCPELWEAPPTDKLNLVNGLLDIETRELHPHSPDFLTAIQVAAAFDATGRCPAWDEFIGGVFPEDSRHIAYEIIALLMLPHRSQQYAVLLLGDGGNGKSTYLSAVTALLGPANVSSLTLHQIEEERFARAELHGKLANICPDNPSKRLASTAIFKAITGGDTLTAERKFKDAFTFVPFVKLIFSCNRPFPSNDDSEGFQQRWRVISFDGRFRGTNREVARDTLDARLRTPHELSGVLSKALEVLPAVQRRGLDITASMREAAVRFQRTASPIAAWLDARTVSHPDAVVCKRDLIDEYNRDAVQQGRPTVSDKEFGTAVRNARPQLTDTQRRIAGVQKDCYVGLRLAGKPER